jgi:GH24 family phage-related lysozyme (muramidase)
MNLEQLQKDLEVDEGVVYAVYKDHLGYPTFGIGHLILDSDPEYGQEDDTPVSEDRVTEAFQSDCESVLKDCDILYPDFDDLPEEAQLVIANMMFNMGRPRLSKFKGAALMLEIGMLPLTKWLTQDGTSKLLTVLIDSSIE